MESNKRIGPELMPPILIFGTSFTDEFFGLRYNEDFRIVYRTKSSIPTRIVPVIRHLPTDVRFLVLEYPEPFLDSIGAIPVGPHCELPDWRVGAR